MRSAVYAMDRPRQPERWWRGRPVLYVGVGLVVVGAVVAVDRILLAGAGEAAVGREVVAGVERGFLAVTVQGAGTLRPEDERLVTAKTTGVVADVLAPPGATVKAGEALVRLANPQLAQYQRRAAIALAEAEADHRVLLARFEDRKLAAAATVAHATMAAEEADLRLQAETKLLARQAVSNVDYQRTRIHAEQTRTVRSIEERRAEQLAATMVAEREASAARVANRELEFEQSQEAVAALTVRAENAGSVQEVPVVAGESVISGAVIARVADLSHLRAVVRVPETYASNLAVGQSAIVAVQNAEVPAVVSRVDPAVSNGSVVVDLDFTASLPDGVRPDVSVRATITVAEIDDTLFVRRPAGVYDNRSAEVFVAAADADEAIRRRVQFGLGTLRQVQVIEGLQQGDQVIVGSTTRFEDVDVVTIE